ncbi:hypothetical protein COO60DRAFT_1593305 [Scenedesmus sp. NREL 46B-D3]|nr:hypothetical protein COO60DRAFT_1593305 [Scenedesmus sp. NREL 46B-D3]
MLECFFFFTAAALPSTEVHRAEAEASRHACHMVGTQQSCAIAPVLVRATNAVCISMHQQLCCQAGSAEHAVRTVSNTFQCG